jgi:hypothetical protein
MLMLAFLSAYLWNVILPYQNYSTLFPSFVRYGWFQIPLFLLLAASIGLR